MVTMWCETMTSPERLGAVIEGQKPDPVRVIPFISGHTALVCGHPISRFNEDAETCFRCQVLSQEVYRYGGDPLYVYASVPPEVGRRSCQAATFRLRRHRSTCSSW
jgi:hypothetical protein